MGFVAVALCQHTVRRPCLTRLAPGCASAQEVESLRGLRERAAEEKDQYVAGALKFDEEGHERLIQEAIQMDAIVKGDHVSAPRVEELDT